MKIYLTASFIGIFALNKAKEIKDKVLFDKIPKEIVGKLEALEKGKRIEELTEILERLEGNKLTTELPLQLEEFEVKKKKDNLAKKYVDKHLEELAIKNEFVKNREEFIAFLSSLQIERTKRKLKKTLRKDKVMAQAVSALDDLEDISNRFSERLREWYSLYFPELRESIKDNKKFTKIVSEKPSREAHESFDESIGIDLEAQDVEILRKYAKETKEIFELKNKIQNYVEEEMNHVAPNITYLVGGELGAKLIALAGSLKKLAKLPSSTIQLLGAEKALFRHLKGKGKSPKYGVLYKHPEIQKAPEDLRGKVARAIASKLMMAARTDFYTENFRGESYKEELDKRIKEIKEEG